MCSSGTKNKRCPPLVNLSLDAKLRQVDGGYVTVVAFCAIQGANAGGAVLRFRITGKRQNKCMCWYECQRPYVACCSHALNGSYGIAILQQQAVCACSSGKKKKNRYVRRIGKQLPVMVTYC